VHTFSTQVWPAAQRVPQPPQLSGSDRRSVQAPEQATCPGIVHWHIELVQVWPIAQTLLHSPQLRVSLVRLTQAPLQLVGKGGWQLVTQLPALQTSFVLQILPHAPQFAGSDRVSTHWPFAHTVSGALQKHVLPTQGMPGAHELLQAPQFFGSICVFVQAPLQQAPLQQVPLQNVWPGWQKSMHLPEVQLWFAEHARLQPPQFLRSLCVSMQLPLHSVWVPVQPPPVHMPPTQLCSAVQAKLQAPQLKWSLEVSTHDAPH
jgi:hypothetical protein